MVYELIVANKRTGQIFDLSTIATEVTYTTNRTGQPGTLKFTLQKAGQLDYLEGDEVRLSVDGQLIFYGWVFTKKKDRWGKIENTCYDRLRYLKASAVYAFYDQTAESIIQQICADLQVDIGTIEATGYTLPEYIKDQETSCLDIISEVLEQVLLNTGKIFVLYDNGDGVSLSSPENMKSEIMLGDASYVGDYTYTTDIDEQTYNSIKLARPNEETGRADVFVTEDSENMGKWGKLQYYAQVDESLNDAQIAERGAQMLEYYNRRLRTLKVESLGVPGLRAGQMVYMHIYQLGDINLEQWVLLEKVTHKFEQNFHTMTLETMELG